MLKPIPSRVKASMVKPLILALKIGTQAHATQNVRNGMRSEDTGQGECDKLKGNRTETTGKFFGMLGLIYGARVI